MVRLRINNIKKSGSEKKISSVIIEFQQKYYLSFFIAYYIFQLEHDTDNLYAFQILDMLSI